LTLNVNNIASSISLIENNSPKKKDVLSKLYSKTGKAQRIGITGPPGAGKSSLIDNLIRNLRSANKKVAVLCIDPTSPFSGGAILGDRIRMLQHHSDKGVFIRSMASRNASGGLSLATSEAADILDASGFDVIIFETLGVGQVEIDVINETDTVVVVLVPESGDDIQMMKSGLIEIADLYVVNKSDRQGSNRLVLTLKNMLDTNPSLVKEDWDIPVLMTNALSGEGVEELINSIDKHFKHLSKGGHLLKKINDRYRRQVKSIIQNRYEKHLWKDDAKAHQLEEQLSKKIKDRLSPIELADIVLKDEKY
jgi:LAO/AO transport system kinase